MIPDSYRSEYIAEQVKLIQSRIRTSCLVLMSLWVATMVLGFILRPRNTDPMRPWVSVYLLILCYTVWVLSRKAKTLRWAKVLCYSLMVNVLVMLSVIPAEASSSFSDINFILTLFFFVLFLPWGLWDVAVLWFFHCVAWTLYYFSRNLSGYSLPPTIFGHHPYVNGQIYIFFAAFICFVARRKDNIRDVRAFLLLKNIEAKKDQMERELELASRVHNTLIPKSLLTPDVDIAVSYRPMESVGGDYAKFYVSDDPDDRKLIFLISDVTGHGVAAALMVNRLHTEFEALARKAKSPGGLLKELNIFILKDFENTNMYLSAVCGMISFDPPKFLYSNYGHPAQYLYYLRDHQIFNLESHTTLLGIDLPDGGKIYEAQAPYSHGDKLLLFTDGVLEIENSEGEQFGVERLRSFLKENAKLPSQDLNELLMRQLSLFSSGQFKDDVFILTIESKKKA